MLDLSGVELNGLKILCKMIIEQDAEYKDITEIQIAKHRNGPVGMMKLRFLKEYGKFVEGLKID
nr:DnaB-like helicase C-terminal domain-containing protein [Bacillus pseudomycoides]